MTTLTNSTSSSITRQNSDAKVEIMSATIDFSNSSNTLAQNDVLQAIAIPAKSFVRGVQWEVLTVEGASRNFAVGDGSATSGYIATTSANSATSGSSLLALTEGTPNTVTGYYAGKYYAAADTIDVLAVTSGGLTTCKLKISAVVERF